MKPIILASGSPRRKALLEQVGLDFIVETRTQEEALDANMDPQTLACRISLQKANSVAGFYPDAVIIAADTFGVIDGKIIGKPHSPEEAVEMLTLLSGRSHSVITGYTVRDTGTGKTVSRSVETLVYVKSLTSSEIEAYVKSGEPLDKAGAYAIQGLGALLIEKIEGDYFNVMGLPLFSLAATLKEFGISLL